MFSTIIETEFYKNSTQMLFLAVALIVIHLSLYFIFAMRFDNPDDKKKLRLRLSYISSILFVFFAAKIWVQGFTHIFYGLSLVSAGLVVTNKESIMNLVAWGIISWRGLFTEGDYIEIGDTRGYVYELGVFYFKLFEASPHLPNRVTGRIIKVPNGLVINTVIKSVRGKRHLIEQHIDLCVPVNFNVYPHLKERVESKLKADFNERYGKLILSLEKNLKKDSKILGGYLFQPPTVTIDVVNKTEGEIKLSICFLSLPEDVALLSEQYKQIVFEEVRLHSAKDMKPDNHKLSATT